MIGDHCIAMISDAVMKDIPGFDYNRAYTLMRKNAFTPNTDPASYRDGKGRRALSSYLKYGYVPLEDSVKEAYHKGEQVSRTLEYAYDDFVLAQVAKKLGKTDDYEALMKRAQNYRNVIDPSTGFARGRYANGSWITPFDENKFVPFITEGTPYHYTWYVPQDVAGLMQQIGGKEKFIQRLDTFFEGDYYWHEGNTFSGYELYRGIKHYFYLEFDQKVLQADTLTVNKSNAVYAKFGDKTSKVCARYGVSYINVEQAKKNLRKEINTYDEATLIPLARKA